MRRFLVCLSSAAMLIVTGIAIAPTASAAISGASITPSQWAPASTNQTVLTWTESSASSNTAAFNDSNPSAGGDFISVEVGWGWTFTGANPTATAVTYAATWDSSAKTFTCATIGTVFASSGFSSTGSGPQCLVRRSSVGSSNPGQQVVLGNTGGGSFSLSAGSVVTVTFPSGKVISPASAPASDTWRIISLTVANTVTVSTTVPAEGGAGSLAPIDTIDLDGNGGECTPTKVQGYNTTWTTLTVKSCVHPLGYGLTGWATSPKPGPNDVFIQPGGALYFGGSNRLYAQWEALRLAGAPTDLVATAGWNSVSVSFQAPSDAGSYPITNYLVSSVPGNKACITTVGLDRAPLTCTYTNLTPGTKYTFEAQALNGVGWSDRSKSSNAVAPYNLRITDYGWKKGNLLSLFKSTVSVKLATPGYAPGVKITPMVKVGTGDFVKEATVTTNASGSITWTKKFDRKYDSSPIVVKFMDGGNASNAVNVKDSNRPKPAIKVEAYRDTNARGQRVIVVTGTASNFTPGTELSASVMQDGRKFFKTIQPGVIMVIFPDRSPSSPAQVVIEGGGVKAGPITVKGSKN